MEGGLLDAYLFVYGSFLALIGASVIMLINFVTGKKNLS